MNSEPSDRGLAVSPINSPTRKKKDSNNSRKYISQEEDDESDESLQDTDSEESVSIRSPPPAYVSGGSSQVSYAEQSKKSSHAYSNLMSFLDEASEALPPPQRSQQQTNQSPRKTRNSGNGVPNPNEQVSPLDIEITREGGIRDDLSSMSYSMNSSIQESKAFTSNKYIWNELDEHDDYGGGRGYGVGNGAGGSADSHAQPPSYTSSTTNTFFRAPPTHNSSNSSHGNSNSSKKSLQSNVEEIQEKVANMQQELRKKNQRMKDLQSELARLKSVKERKRSKLSEKYAKELNELTATNNQALQKQKDFVDKLQDAVETLQSKAQHLQEKLESNSQTLESAVEAAKTDGVRSIRRAQRQWETDERTLFEKLSANKRESMQKAANDHIAPKLEKLVKTNQEHLLRKREEAEKLLVQRRAEYKESLQADFDKAVRDLRERHADDESSHLSRNRKVEEVKHRHESEIKALKTRFAQDQRMLEESSDRTRRLDSDSHLASMTSLRNMEQKALEDWMRKQQREINGALQRHETELRDAERREKEVFAQWVQQQDKQEEKVQSHRLEKRRAEMILSAKQEVETVRARLRAEAVSEREQRSRRAEEELKALRLEIQDKLQGQYDADKRSSSMAASLHSEVERLQDRLYQHRSSVTELKEVVESERRKSRLVAVENTIDGVSFERSAKQRGDSDRQDMTRNSADFSVIEQAVITLKTQLGEELARLEYEGNRSIEEAEKVLEKARREKAAQEMAQHKQYTARKTALSDDFTRIEDKISVLLSRKNRAISDMRQTLQDLQTRNRDFEQQLDEFRNKKIGGG